MFHSNEATDELEKLKKENGQLRKKLVDEKKLVAENNALRDQFKSNTPSGSKLLPAQVIGAPAFMPGVSQPEKLILAVGKKDGVKKGDVVLVNNNLIGNIERVFSTMSVVLPLTVFSRPFTAKTLGTNAIGLIRSTNGGLYLENVVLSETLKKGDIVVTKGDVDETESGFAPDIIIGKIVSIDKKASNLFQSAKVQSLVDLSKVTIVFIYHTI